MGRAKVAMELIKSQKSRRNTYKKRKSGLKKKAYELSTLCNVDVCLIVRAPTLDDHLTIWPNPHKLNEMISRFRNKPIEDSNKRTRNLSNFYEDRKKKVKDDLLRLRRKNTALKYPTWDNQFNLLPKEDLRDLARLITNKLEIAIARFEFLESQKFEALKQGGKNLKRNFGLEIFEQHSIPSTSLDHLDMPIHIPYDDHNPQGVTTYDPNSMVSPLMTTLMGTTDGSQYGAFSGNMVSYPTNELFYYDPMVEVSNPINGSFYPGPMVEAATNDNMMLNNQGPPTLCHYCLTRQHIQPYMPHTVMPSPAAHMHSSQIRVLPTQWLSGKK